MTLTFKNHRGDWIGTSKLLFKETLCRLYYNSQHGDKQAAYTKTKVVKLSD